MKNDAPKMNLKISKGDVCVREAHGKAENTNKTKRRKKEQDMWFLPGQSQDSQRRVMSLVKIQ